jgi:cytochrome c oxidase subunit 2
VLNELFRRMLFLPPQASTMAAEVDALHYFVISATMLGAFLITVVGAVFVIRYRHSPDAPLAREQRGVTPPRWAEIGAIGGLFGLFCLWWVIGYLQYVRLRVAPENTLDIYVTGKQWMWKAAYPDGQQTIANIYVPSGRAVRVVLASRDVIHSFYVPDFRIKQDVVPGRTTIAWFEAPAPGVHQILCAEYCGTGHSFMRGQVVVLTPSDYARWLDRGRTGVPPAEEAAEPAQPTDLVRVGEAAAAQQGCLRCHTLDGTPHIGPSWGGLYRASVPLSSGAHIIADEAFLTESMMDPLAKVHQGYLPVMPSYHGLLSPGEVGAILELIKSIATGPIRPPPPDVPAAAAGEIGRAPPVAGLGASVQEGLPPPGVQPNPLPIGPVYVPLSRLQSDGGADAGAPDSLRPPANPSPRKRP